MGTTHAGVSAGSVASSEGSRHRPVTFAHIGAGKCGSSAIQTHFSKHPEMNYLAGGILTYGALTSQGLLCGSAIRKKLNHSISGYVSSASNAQITKWNQKTYKKNIGQMARCPNDLFLSCEGWLSLFRTQSGIDRIMPLLSGGGRREVRLAAFVRPPVKWINSAWWQWGAWEKGVDFETWLKGAIRACDWSSLLRNIPAETELIVRPVLGDVVGQMCDIIGCEMPQASAQISNKSLSAEFLSLFLQFRDLRPSPHAAVSDFLATRAVAQSEFSYRGTPWVLSPEHIDLIIERTRETNLELLGFMDASDRTRIENDAAWWAADAYAGMTFSPPLGPLILPEESLANLGADIFRSYRHSMKVLARHGLLSELEEEIRK